MYVHKVKATLLLFFPVLFEVENKVSVLCDGRFKAQCEGSIADPVQQLMNDREQK